MTSTSPAGAPSNPPDKRLLFVVPSHLGRSAVVDSVRIQSAKLAEALGEALGLSVDVLTPHGLGAPPEIESSAVLGTSIPSVTRSAVHRMPRQIALLLAEVRRCVRALQFRRAALRFVGDRRYALVVQLHARYETAGRALARRSNAPYVLRVEALEIREDMDWGIQRPVWGQLALQLGELRLIRQADLVAVISSVLDRELQQLDGTGGAKRLIVPSGVDTRQFSPAPPDLVFRERHGLNGRFVVGWVGGFRPFHGLDDVVEIAGELRRRCPEALLCLVGTGPLFETVRLATTGLKDNVLLVGPVAHESVSMWIRAFDCCLLLSSAMQFHYSPLKLYEYMACGKPVVSANVGDIGKVIQDGMNGILVPPRDPMTTADAIVRLASDPWLRRALGQSARETVERTASWTLRAQSVIEELSARGLLAV